VETGRSTGINTNITDVEDSARTSDVQELGVEGRQKSSGASSAASQRSSRNTFKASPSPITSAYNAARELEEFDSPTPRREPYPRTASQLDERVEREKEEDEAEKEHAVGELRAVNEVYEHLNLERKSQAMMGMARATLPIAKSISTTHNVVDKPDPVPTQGESSVIEPEVEEKPVQEVGSEQACERETYKRCGCLKPTAKEAPLAETQSQGCKMGQTDCMIYPKITPTSKVAEMVKEIESKEDTKPSRGRAKRSATMPEHEPTEQEDINQSNDPATNQAALDASSETVNESSEGQKENIEEQDAPISNVVSLETNDSVHKDEPTRQESKASSGGVSQRSNTSSATVKSVRAATKASVAKMTRAQSDAYSGGDEQSRKTSSRSSVFLNSAREAKDKGLKALGETFSIPTQNAEPPAAEEKGSEVTRDMVETRQQVDNGGDEVRRASGTESKRGSRRGSLSRAQLQAIEVCGSSENY